MSEDIATRIEHMPLVLGIDIGGTQLRVAVLQGAKLHSRVAMLTGENPTPERVLPRVYNAVQQALSEAHITLEQVAGIGVAVPGPLNQQTGVTYAPPNLPAWTNVPLLAMLRQHYEQFIVIENDAKTACLGEYMFGAGRGCANIVYLTISTGIGGGAIINGRLLEGVGGAATELGHMTINLHGERCPCGNIGCLEYLASGTAIARKANEAIAAGQGTELLAFARTMLEHTDSVPDPAALPAQDMHTQPLDESQLAYLHEDDEPLLVNARTVARAAEAGIPLARAILTQAAEALGVGLVNILHIFNPEKIILGGGVTQMGPMLMEPALRVVQERAMQAQREAARIELAQLGKNVGLVGAGALVYYHQPSHVQHA